MGQYLSLPRGRLVRFVGWGKVIQSEEHNCRVELVDVGECVIYRAGTFREKVLATIPITQLHLGVYTKQLTSGTTWTGGGIGILGALSGQANADFLNWLTSRTEQLTILRACALLPNGARRDASLGFLNLDESTIRDHLAKALRQWVDAYVTTRSHQIEPGSVHPDLRQLHGDIDRIHKTGTITAAQAAQLGRLASEPFIQAVLDRLDTTPASPAEAHRITNEVHQLKAGGHLTEAQAARITSKLAPTLRPAPPHTPPTPEQQRQLHALAALRSLGAMSDAQFEREKAQLLHGGR